MQTQPHTSTLTIVVRNAQGVNIVPPVTVRSPGESKPAGQRFRVSRL